MKRKMLLSCCCWMSVSSINTDETPAAFNNVNKDAEPKTSSKTQGRVTHFLSTFTPTDRTRKTQNLIITWHYLWKRCMVRIIINPDRNRTGYWRSVSDRCYGRQAVINTAVTYSDISCICRSTQSVVPVPEAAIARHTFGTLWTEFWFYIKRSVSIDNK